MRRNTTDKANIVFKWAFLAAVVIIMTAIVFVIVRQLLSNPSVQDKLMTVLFDNYKIAIGIVFGVFGLKAKQSWWH